MSESIISMKEVTEKDYKDYLRFHKEVIIGKTRIAVGEPKEFQEYQPQEFQLERTNLWSYPKRGSWATHKSDFRGNWPPQMVRNLILRYSKPEEIVLDQMCGSGTTLIECKLLGRNGIGVDINPNCVMLTQDRLDFQYNPVEPNSHRVFQKTYVGDARNLSIIENETIDLISTHPPYANIISYSTRKKRVYGDLSFARTLEGYLTGMNEIAKESYRVLKPGRFCAILMGDTRKHRHHVPISFMVMQEFLKNGFILREDIVKHQWKTKATIKEWQGLSKVAKECWIDYFGKRGVFTDFLLLSYEHLFVFRKPLPNEDLKPYIGSMKLKNGRQD